MSVAKSDPRSVRILEFGTFGLGAAVVLLFVWVVIGRIAHPVQAEWMTGSIRDAVERARDGKPIYAEPSATFIPFLYPPVYYWVAGLLAHVMSTFAACKVVSLAATAAVAWGIWSIARSLGAARSWSAYAVLLLFAAYAPTLYFYDLERVDMLGIAVVVVALALLLVDGNGQLSTPRTVAAGALFGLAFFVKQPGLLAFVMAVAGLAFAKQWRRAVIVGVAGGVVFLALFAYLEVRTGGWFRYYCMKLPRSHGVEPALLSTFFIEDVPKLFVLMAGSVAVVAPVLAAVVKRQRPNENEWQNTVFAFVLLAGLVGGYFLRAHRGGWSNVILAWTPLGCVAAGIVASRLAERASQTPVGDAVKLVLLGGFSLQMLSGMYDPNENTPGPTVLRETNRFEALVRKIEAEQGEVIVTPMSHVTKTPHLHAAALYDVLRAGDPAPAEYLDGLRSRRYAALFTGAPQEFVCELQSCIDVTITTLENYFVGAQLREPTKAGLAGFDGRPRWVLRPRKTPIHGLTRDELERRLQFEVGLAEKRRAQAPKDAEILPDDTIEDLAATEEQRALETK